MAHSYIIGGGLEFEVRDSICEAILERLKDELVNNGSSQPALEVVKRWYDYWYTMPPGCKELTIECPSPKVRIAVINALLVVVSTLNPDGEQLRVAKQIKEILME